MVIVPVGLRSSAAEMSVVKMVTRMRIVVFIVYSGV
jgi:hypothetical protein